MKPYPSIPSARDKKLPFGAECVGFYKYDGSNLRFEWSRKRGFYKFGTRHRLFGEDEAPYNQGLAFFKQHMAAAIETQMKNKYSGITDFIVFAEMFGPSSFAGSHDLNEPKELKLFDVWLPRKGLIPPLTFVSHFGSHPWAATPIYQGPFDQDLIKDVRAGLHPVDEGMVVKGVDGTWTAKIKTEAYLAKLREKLGQDWEKFAE